ncbi:MAG: Methyltransferase family protein, partial [Candidatus Amesbacteria bacterium GW2011_GWC1_46_24]
MIQKLRLNLGCGDDLIPGYINIDARPQVRPDLIWNLRRPLPYPDESVSEIKAYDILEHLTLKEQENSLREMYRLLSVNGRIQIRIPNPDDIISRF